MSTETSAQPAGREAGLSPRATSIALVGYGYWGPNLARAINGLEAGKLSYVVDASPSRRTLVERVPPHVRTTDKLDAVLEDPTVDGIVLATPAESHHPLAKQA